MKKIFPVIFLLCAKNIFCQTSSITFPLQTIGTNFNVTYSVGENNVKSILFTWGTESDLKIALATADKRSSVLPENDEVITAIQQAKGVGITAADIKIISTPIFDNLSHKDSIIVSYELHYSKSNFLVFNTGVQDEIYNDLNAKTGGKIGTKENFLKALSSHLSFTNETSSVRNTQETLAASVTETFGSGTRIVKVNDLRGWVLNTNFNLPIVRFNFLDKGSNAAAKGTVTLFNSLGAGISINRARVKQINNTDADNTKVDNQMTNLYGLSVGVLYAANTSDSNKVNTFAPVVSLQILNFQVGVGYELGDKPLNSRRTFVTVSYGIPLQNLFDVGSYLIGNTGAKLKKGDKLKLQTDNKGAFL